MNSYPLHSRPHIQTNHTDGPVLILRDGRLKWLTWHDRIAIFFGRTNALALEKKYWKNRGLL